MYICGKSDKRTSNGFLWFFYRWGGIRTCILLSFHYTLIYVCSKLFISCLAFILIYLLKTHNMGKYAMHQRQCFSNRLSSIIWKSNTASSKCSSAKILYSAALHDMYILNVIINNFTLQKIALFCFNVLYMYVCVCVCVSEFSKLDFIITKTVSHTPNPQNECNYFLYLHVNIILFHWVNFFP